MCLDEENGWRLCGCVIDLWLMPLVCTLGLFLNICCLLVFFSHKHHPLVPALIVLSMSDCLQLLFSFFVLVIPALHDFSSSEPYSNLGQLAYLSTGLLSPLLLAFNCASIWTICYISIQRHKAILSPLSNIYSPSKPFKPLIFIALVALLFNVSKWAEFNWKWEQVPVNSTSENYFFLMHEPSELARSERYHRILDNMLYPVMVYLVPLLLLSVLNLRILSHISRRDVSFEHKSRFAQERRSVILLMSIVITFFLCHTGGLLIRFVDQEKHHDSELFVLFKDVINLLFNLNSLANPMLYFLFTRQFRDLRTMLHSHFSSPGTRCEIIGHPSSHCGPRLRPVSTSSFYRSPSQSGKLLD
ncbi:unnamed protein product [Caenorhabditis auriculariae]|uniref:G-protein coupled receptors family 1 profile domain-containing protein n=1 Tax=Caenorhabditis auriculariae TaxID=2777116 RepID=A0A8S1H4X0_9PELO|nr:unnamed protein product [Caenorhabditis auriculariae]